MSVAVTVDTVALADLVTFARIEVEAADVEPWAEMLRALHEAGDLDVEQTHWAVKLYNAYDSLGSAFGARARWDSPAAWWAASPAERATAADFPCTQERRNLRAGKVVRHLDSYVEALAGQSQATWVRSGILSDNRALAYKSLMYLMRTVWGVGRQTAFEWAEFVEKALAAPVAAADAELWESEGPRRSLQRIYGNPNPDRAWLDAVATDCRDHLAAEGVSLSWEDFETIICDFNVMRDGRYYPGRHLAALKEEIMEAPPAERAMLERAWSAIVPVAWQDIPPGIDRDLCRVYRDTGVIRDHA